MLMLNVTFSFGSLNVRGLRDIIKRKAIFLFCKGSKSQSLFLQETHSSEADETFCETNGGTRFSLAMVLIVLGGYRYVLTTVLVKL